MTENLVSSIVLGLIQGASEFLPISSSGHLVIAPKLFGFNDPGLTFDVALHFGTLIAVAAFFYKDWIEIFKLTYNKFTKREGKTKSIYGFTSETLWILAVATIPGVLAGLFLEEMAETVFRNPSIVAFNLFFWGLILYLIDRYSKKKRKIENIKFLDGVLIGFSQALAIIPGTSRSGITISTGMARGLDRKAAARFSFLMLAPIAFGASVLKSGELVSNFNLTVLVGIVVSAVSGYLAIKYLLKFLEKASYKIFFWYRFLIAILILFFII